MDAREVIGFIMVLAIIGILGTVSIYINEKVADKTALTVNDTYYNASQDVVASVETGWDFTEIVIIAIAAGLIIAAIFGVIGGYIKL